ncbi:purple acid phosphatase 3 [Penicillium atrosanguineum]|uniref:Purple acid phosphatase 3 n=1 Tax=Penicillium atrosanguineum TaxID=1132637 RepID=A0A9W9PQF3_9EURO|nr:purple acid phosphatase 3 [Penicillium atrosanguineum]
MSHIPHVALTLSLALGAAAARNSIVASKGAETLAVGIFGGPSKNWKGENIEVFKKCLGVDFTSDGVQRFYECWADMYVGDAFDDQAGVDFQRLFAPLIDDRWCFGHDHLP